MCDTKIYKKLNKYVYIHPIEGVIEWHEDISSVADFCSAKGCARYTEGEEADTMARPYLYDVVNDPPAAVNTALAAARAKAREGLHE